VLLVSTYSEIPVVKAFITAGAHGYVMKDVGRPQLTQAVRELHRGDLTVSSEVAGRVIDEMRVLVRVRTRTADWLPANVASFSRADDDPEGASPVPGLERLTPREQDVLALLLDGHRVSEIAGDLFVSQSTVRDHLSSIFKKVGVSSQAELIRRLRLE
jgi:DNA-binding NarL/FixJ family response regulator